MHASSYLNENHGVNESSTRRRRVPAKAGASNELEALVAETEFTSPRPETSGNEIEELHAVTFRGSLHTRLAVADDGLRQIKK